MNVVRLKRQVRPLRKTYNPSMPYAVERQDEDDGSITYEVIDTRPDHYRIVCRTNDDVGGNPMAKHDAEQAARGLNMLIQYGLERLPNLPDKGDCDV